MLKALEFVQDDQVRFKRVQADLSKLVAQRTDKSRPVGEIAMGPVLSLPAEPLAEIVELLAKALLTMTPSKTVMVFDGFREATHQLRIHWLLVHVAQVPTEPLIGTHTALEDSARTYPAELCTPPRFPEQPMQKSSLTRDPTRRLEVE
jgi:hypothetical protein